MSKRSLQCAIYTRKSSEEGLEQGFNSLDAQREACEAFIKSQQHEGWIMVPTLYDDGGYSGGNIERPALKQLLNDIEQKKIHVVVVYKVDRLTRSLADFAKIVEQFDAKGISFVSVTQQFNTTSSMGRLTLNVLLSFAQFEREVTGERIRDKIAASKQKGLWMGGTAPIGYLGQERTLVIDTAHAAIVLGIYQKYLALGSIRALKVDLDNNQILSPERVRLSGASYGGKPFSRGNLHRILSNPVYTGKMVHFEKTYEGQHPAIIDQTLWNAVQAMLEDNQQGYLQRPRVPSESFLTGILFDDAGIKLHPSYSQKQSKRFRYYISQALINEGRNSSPQGLRLPAQELEGLIINRICAWLGNTNTLLHALHVVPEHIQLVLARVEILIVELKGNVSQQNQVIHGLINRITVNRDYIVIALRSEYIFEAQTSRNKELNNIILKVHVQLKRCGYAMRLIVNGDSKKQPLLDHHLIANIAKAHQWFSLLTSGRVKNIKELAQQENIDSSHVRRMLHRAFLAPDIVRAILNGTQPVHFNLKYLKQFRALPVDWNEQFKLFRF